MVAAIMVGGSERDGDRAARKMPHIVSGDAPDGQPVETQGPFC